MSERTADSASSSAASDDDLVTAAREGSLSAGEVGRADASAAGPNDVQVIIGEIPDADDPTVLRWTARCSWPQHDLLGHYDSEEAAGAAKEQHLVSQH